jgi:hypothetical protein
MEQIVVYQYRISELILLTFIPLSKLLLIRSSRNPIQDSGDILDSTENATITFFFDFHLNST